MKRSVPLSVEVVSSVTVFFFSGLSTIRSIHLLFLLKLLNLRSHYIMGI